MKTPRPIQWLADKIDTLTNQGKFEYDFGYDVAQKLTFILTVLIIPWRWGSYAFAMFIFCCIIGRIVVMSKLQETINRIVLTLGGRKSTMPFLWIPPKIWKLIVFVILTYLMVNELIIEQQAGDFTALPCVLIMYFVGFFIFAGQTGLTQTPSDPNKIGSAAWKEANGVIKVNRDLMNPLYRDKYGNYYEGTNFVPVAAPVNITNKKSK